MKRFVNRGLLVERESCIDLGGYLAGNDLQDFPSELHEKAIKCRIDFFVQCVTLLKLLSDHGVSYSGPPHVFLAILDRRIHQLGILSFLRGSKDEGRIGRGILWLVLGNGWKNCE